uniref:Uncharacterized protein n=1 Tax=Zea mays TaxID=4577 RepID=C4J4D3_MAIZE|nr:unknown [Zea mays]
MPSPHCRAPASGSRRGRRRRPGEPGPPGAGRRSGTAAPDRSGLDLRLASGCAAANSHPSPTRKLPPQPDRQRCRIPTPTAIFTRTVLASKPHQTRDS